MQRSKNASEPKGLTKANHAPTNFVFEPSTKTCGSEPGRSTTIAELQVPAKIGLLLPKRPVIPEGLQLNHLFYQEHSPFFPDAFPFPAHLPIDRH